MKKVAIVLCLLMISSFSNAIVVCGEASACGGGGGTSGGGTTTGTCTVTTYCYVGTKLTGSVSCTSPNNRCYKTATFVTCNGNTTKCN